MRFTTAIGGLIGFALVAVTGLFFRRDPALCLLEASVACLIIAMLVRWLHQSFARHVVASVEARRLARANAEKAQTAKS